MARRGGNGRPRRAAAGSRLCVAAGLMLGLAAPAYGVSPEWAAAGSFVLPGLGQTLNGDYGYGALHFGGFVYFLSEYSARSEEDDFIEREDRVDNENNEIRTNRTTFEADLFLAAAFNLELYSAYGAYRDGRMAMDNEGYDTPAPKESYGELALAPFKWEFLSRPTVFLPLIIPLSFFASPPSDRRFLFAPDNSISREEMAVGFFAQHNMVAVGEESFFRGVLNNGFSDAYGEGWGLFLSSLVFGLGHQGNAGQASALGAGVFGLYVGYLQQLNDYEIGQGVAIHFWWNFLISLGMLARREGGEEVTLFAFATRF